MSSLINEVTLTGKIIKPTELVGFIQSAHFLYGEINSQNTIQGMISNGSIGNLVGVLHSESTLQGSISLAKTFEQYKGDYIVTPHVYAQSLKTENKVMTEDVQVLEIPYYETSNETGYTVYIGGNNGE